MGSSSRERPDPVHRPATGNRRWKAGWGSRLAWSIALAAALHGAIFALLPSWEAGGPSSSGAGADEVGSVGSVHLVAVGEPEGREPGPSAASAPDPERARPDGAAGNGGRVERRERAPRRPERREAPAPATPTPDPAERAADPWSPVVRTEVAAPGRPPLAARPTRRIDDGHLDIERLATAIPGGPERSPWVLVSNPTEVERFLRRLGLYGGGGETRSVGVSLLIDEEGAVEHAEIARSSGWFALDRIVLRLFRKIIRFDPARAGGEPVPTAAVFSVGVPGAR